MSGSHRSRSRAGALKDAEALIAAGRGIEARALLEDQPRADADPGLQRLLAIEALLAHDAVRALRHASAALSLQPASAFAHMLVGRAHKAAGQWAEAEAAYRRALLLDARLAEAHVSLGIVLRARGDLPGAVACQRRALRLQPNLAAAHANLGVALAALIEQRGAGLDTGSATGPTTGPAPGTGDEALAALRQAVAAAPREITARHHLSVALTQAGHLDEAAEQLNTALAIEPARLDSCLMLHAVLARAGWQAGARAVCEKWLSINPLHAEVASRLATTLLALDEVDAAVEWAQRALPLAPQMPELHHNLAHALQQRLDVAGALHHLALANVAGPAYAGAWHARAMAINYIETDPRAVVALHRQAAAACFPVLANCQPPRLQARSNDPRPLRVGFVSGDLRRHSVAYFIEPLFDGHDRRRFEFHAYSTADHPDDVSQRLRGQVAHWSDVARLGDSALAGRIAADGIDVLIDLSGHTADTRLGVFAQRAAPLQATYLGYPTTTGLAAIDLRITDAVIDPPGSEPASVEALLRLPGSMFCFRPDQRVAASVAPLPALRGGGGGGVRFGSFNNLAKLSPVTVALWARVLHRVPGSSLHLKARALTSAGVRQCVLSAFAAHGIGAARLRLDAWRADLATHLSAYDEIDIGLDTFPFNGATTTCEALWMGVPVLSLAGATHVSRMGSSILHAAGLHDAVVADADEFVARAALWAGDLAALAERRRGLREQLVASTLMDQKGFVHGFEQALLAACGAGFGAASHAAGVVAGVAAGVAPADRPGGRRLDAAVSPFA